MFGNQFGDFIDLDPYSSNFVDPDTINPDLHHYYVSMKLIKYLFFLFYFMAYLLLISYNRYSLHRWTMWVAIRRSINKLLDEDFCNQEILGPNRTANISDGKFRPYFIHSGPIGNHIH